MVGSFNLEYIHSSIRIGLCRVWSDAALFLYRFMSLQYIYCAIDLNRGIIWELLYPLEYSRKIHTELRASG